MGGGAVELVLLLIHWETGYGPLFVQYRKCYEVFCRDNALHYC
jgi:hypothetical protein